MTFQEFGLHESLSRVLPEIGFENPTPVQVQAIPLVMTGRDLLGSAQTGTGKTAAFLLPILHRLITEPATGLQVLVLEPTRELALQVEEQAKLFSQYTPFRAACIYGGVGFGPQEKAFQDGVEIIAATPGRLLDHLRQGNVRFNTLRVLVLDEVDRMLDMGFLPDVRSILRALPEQRQTLFFSATVPGEIQYLCDSMLKNPERVNIAPDRKTAEGITQTVYPVTDHLKAKLLEVLLEQEHVTSALVFTRTKQGADKVCAVIERKGMAVRRIHGDLSQGQRLRALTDFKDGVAKFLVATDIAARGLDVEGISHVINYDLPDSPDDYVHRIGRTARAQATGHAYSLASPREAMQLAAIEKHLAQKLEKVTMQNFNYDETLGTQHEVRQGHDGINDYEKLGSGEVTVARPFRDKDENATVIVRYGASDTSQEFEEGMPMSGRSGEGSGGGGRGRERGGRGRDRDRGGRGRDRDRAPREDREPRRDEGRSETQAASDNGNGNGRSRAQEESERRQANQSMSASEVLRRAGSQRAFIESDVRELRPRTSSEGEGVAEGASPVEPAPFFAQNTENTPGRSEAPQPRRELTFEPRPQGQGERMQGEGSGRSRRRRGRGGRGDGARDSQGRNDGRPQGQSSGGPRRDQGARPQEAGGRERFDRGPQGGRNQQGGRPWERDGRRENSEAPKPASGGLWQKLKGVFGLGAAGRDSGKW